MKVGYARVSDVAGSQESGLETQIQILEKNGVSKIFSEMRSGTTMKGRTALRECLDFVRAVSYTHLTLPTRLMV